MFGMLKEAVVTAYDKIVDAVISSSAAVLDLPLSVERSVVSDQIRAQVASISSVLDPELFVDRLNERAAQSKFAAAVGSKNANPQDCDIFSANPKDSDPNDTNFKSLHPLEYLVECECELFEDIQKSFVSASHAEKPKGVTPEILMKVWSIDNATAKRTINVTSQLARQDANTTLSRNFGTNNRMLRYRRIASYFYTDCFFVTKNVGQRKASSSRGYT